MQLWSLRKQCQKGKLKQPPVLGQGLCHRTVRGCFAKGVTTTLQGPNSHGSALAFSAGQWTSRSGCLTASKKSVGIQVARTSATKQSPGNLQYSELRASQESCNPQLSCLKQVHLSQAPVKMPRCDWSLRPKHPSKRGAKTPSKVCKPAILELPLYTYRTKLRALSCAVWAPG